VHTQVNSSGGIAAALGEANANVEACGKINWAGAIEFHGSTSVGSPRRGTRFCVSKMCAPQSPNAPLPKSNHGATRRWCTFVVRMLARGGEPDVATSGLGNGLFRQVTRYLIPCHRRLTIHERGDLGDVFDDAGIRPTP